MAKQDASFLEALQALGRDNFITQAGEYWARDNAQFEKTDPSLLDRVVRSVNPMTGFGSAMGTMHDAAGQADPRGMGLSILQALPMFASLKGVAIPAAGAYKASTSMAPSLFKTLVKGTAGTATTVAADEADAYVNRRDR